MVVRSFTFCVSFLVPRTIQTRWGIGKEEDEEV